MSGWSEWSLYTVLARRPAVRINQLGYLPDGPKRAIWVTNEPLPVEFTVVAADGTVALRGQTQPWQRRPEPTSGSRCISLISPISLPRTTAIG